METNEQWVERNTNPNNKKVKCAHLNSEKPHCYPYGYEQCTVNGKVCLFHAYGYDKKSCECFQKPQAVKA